MPKFVLGIRKNPNIFKVEFYTDSKEKAYKMRYLYYLTTGIILDIERSKNDSTVLPKKK